MGVLRHIDPSPGTQSSHRSGMGHCRQGLSQRHGRQMAELQAAGRQAGVPAVQSPAKGHTTQVNESLTLPPGVVEGQWPRIGSVGQMSPRPTGIWVYLGSQGGISPSPCDVRLGTVPPARSSDPKGQSSCPSWQMDPDPLWLLSPLESNTNCSLCP